MSGMFLNMGGLGGGYDTASVPAAAGVSAQGPTSIGQKAFGISAGAGVSAVGVTALLSTGVLSLIGLFWIWYSLPR